MTRPASLDEYLQRYPRTCATIIAFSLGYATPQCAANILRDAHLRQPNWSEWIFECYNTNPLPAVQAAIQSRHALKGYMSEYHEALRIVRRTNRTGEHPDFASWF